MGNPHAVTLLDPETQPGLDELNLERLGPLFERHPLFPQRVNTEFVEVVSRSELRMRVHAARAKPWPAEREPARWLWLACSTTYVIGR